MKTAVTLLLLSLAANAALAFVFLRSSGERQPATSPATRTAPGFRVPSVPATAPRPPLPPALADAIARREPTALVRALREAGFPETYVRDIVMWQIGDSLSAERIAMLRADAAVPFWKLGSDPGRAQRELLQRDLAQKTQEQAREAFGGRVPGHPLENDRLQARYRFLPTDKADAVARIDADYAQVAMESRRDVRSMPTADVIRLLDVERRVDLAKVLSPQEMELYDLHLSASAESLRRQLGGFQPTEAEFRAMYAIRRAQDVQKGTEVSIPGISSFSISNDPATRAAFRPALSPERFAEYERSQDMGYRAAVEIAAHFNLPAGTAERTYELQSSYQQRMRDYRPQSGADRAAYAAVMLELAQEAKAEIVQLLGEAGADAYRQTGGLWLRSIESAGRMGGSGTATPAVRLPGG